MTPDFITGFFFEAIKTAILLAAPMLLAGLGIGLLVSIFQAATQINEMTLSFIPKLFGMLAVLMMAGPMMLRMLIEYFQQIMANLPGMLGG